MRGQQVNQRERIPNAMFVTLSTYLYVGARMLIYSHRGVVYTNADERRFIAWDLYVSIIFLDLDTIHDPFDFYPWLIEIDQKTKFETCYSEII